MVFGGNTGLGMGGQSKADINAQSAKIRNLYKSATRSKNNESSP